jgi:hypothetical protein
MLLGGGPMDILEAIAAGLALVVAVPALLAGMSLFGQRLLDTTIYMVVIALAIYPHPVTPFVALALHAAAYRFGRTQRRAVA